MEAKISGIKIGTDEGKKEIGYQQGCKSKVLAIFCISTHSESADIKLIELKFWNVNHTKHVFLNEQIVSKNRNP